MLKVRTAALAAFVAGASLWCAVANAQVYRIVGADGRVTFSDRAPPDARATPAQTMPLGGGGSPSSALPAEVRAAAQRFPVTIYTGADCGPCLTARSFLLNRGVPFTEKAIVTDNDVQALQRLSGSTSLPFATIGGQHIRGYSDTEWSQYLDAAGYPKTSQLPPSYRNPDATPLVAAQQPSPRQPAPASASRLPQPQAEAPAPSDPGPANPAGIRF
ncbi:MAG TPA: glutaredoxin domain-containing protein [Ramlibacter sp.]|nr:glutaredoxin domain-containing protein [Ramlibacter sp.]